MTGHGWVTPRPDGAVARCGGPAICHGCQQEAKDLVMQADFKAACARGEHDLCYQDGGPCCTCGSRRPRPAPSEAAP